jgi:hypothetical protein
MLGDYYVAEPPVFCPVCAEPVYEWVGFAGPGVWLVWTEGKGEPSLERVLGSMRGDEPVLRESRLPDGEHSVYGMCLGGHHLLAHATVTGGCFRGLHIVDAEGHAGIPLEGSFRLWWTLGRLVSIAKDRPAGRDDVIPATVSALGMNHRCILATRRSARRGDKIVEDEWWIVDVKDERAHGPVPDAELRTRLESLGLPEPDRLTLPEDLGDPRQ